ncbi:MAG TPA: Na+/H+ antiporter NhaC family protein [Vicinamibacteria bacterium]|nr:Na+/H+ antiporter NhaC family protein [Vicinamibacteria bacterium]
MDSPSWLSVLPPLIAIVTALVTKQVFLSLFAGIWLGWSILNGGNVVVGLRDAIQALVDVYKDDGNTRTIIFSAMVGSLIALTQHSGGVEGFIRLVSERGVVATRRGAQVLATLLGLGIFVESTITCLVTGAISRPLFDKLSLSREKLAYLCDSTSAPVCILIPMNGWGAFIMGVLATQGIENPLTTLLYANLFNFYASLAVVLVFFIVISGKDFGPMARAERRARETGKVLRDGAEPLVSTEVLSLPTKPGVEPLARNMLVPMVSMLLMMPVGLYITGDGDLLAGSGSTAVLWAVLLAVVVAAVLYRVQGIFSLAETIDLAFKGLGGLMPVALLMMLAFAIAALSNELKTGIYLASLAENLLRPALVPAVLFVISGFIAFSTGTSWGTFGIMLPIGIPMVGALGVDLHVTVGAVLAGGIFGDHCSPISDTTIVSSMAAGSDHIDHVNTQLPYAITMGLLALAAFLLVGVFH